MTEKHHNEKKEESDLENLKKDYTKIQKEYNLPDFEKLNEDFHIEKVADIETEFLIREIRKFVADKFSNYLRFIEAILHPVNSPIFIFSIIKSISNEDKNLLTESYKKLARNEVELIELDIKFSEKKEAKFVKESYKMWQGIKKDLLEVIGNIKKNWNTKFETNGKGYFG